MAKTPTYTEIHQEHRQWLTDLNFYHDEVKYYQNQLAQIAARDTEDHYHKKIVTFKRRFFETLEQIDKLRYNIYKHEKELAEQEQLAERTRIHINEDHHAKKEEFNKFLDSYEQLKEDFNAFASDALE